MFSKIVVKVGGKEYLIACEDESKQHVYNIAYQLDKKINSLKNRLLEGVNSKNQLFNINNENLLLLQSITLLDENEMLKKEQVSLKNKLKLYSNNFIKEGAPNIDLEKYIQELEEEINLLKNQLFKQ